MFREELKLCLQLEIGTDRYLGSAVVWDEAKPRTKHVRDDDLQCLLLAGKVGLDTS